MTEHVTMTPEQLAMELLTTGQCLGGRSEAERLLEQITDRADAAVRVPATDRTAKAEALLLHFTAEAHRRKWSYDRGLDDDGVPIKSEAFDALHRLGEEMRVALEKLRSAAEPAAAGPDQTQGEAVAQRTVRCSAAVLRRPHGPHNWEPQPGMDPVRCPGACCCEHPDDEHSVYGCAEDCSCEYLPARKRPPMDPVHILGIDAAAASAVGGAQPKEADRVVAYRHPATGALFCVRCAPRKPGDIWTPVTADDLPDGGVCASCGVDVLIPQQPKEAGA